MKKILFVVALMPLFFFLGCSNSSSFAENIAGRWSSYIVSDGDGNMILGAPKYDLQIEQNGTYIEAILNIYSTEDTTVVNMSGTVVGDDFTLNGNKKDARYDIEGFLENNNSMQINVIKNLDLNNPENMTAQHVLLKSTTLYLSPPATNTYELKNECGSGNSKNIILVHGFNSNSGIWGSMVNHFNKNGICDRYSVWTYQYDWKRHIEQSATDMISRVNTNIQNDKPIIIAHSMGGLVSRSYIAQHGYYDRLITLGTPHEGISEASKVVGWSYDGLNDMEPDSEFITNLNSNSFEQSQRANYLLLNGKIDHEWICTRTILSHCTWGYFKWTGDYPTSIKAGYFFNSRPNDGIVSQDSSRFNSDSNVERADADKFKWICHDWLPYKSLVMEYVTHQL